MNSLYDANFDQDAEYWDAVEAAATAPTEATEQIRHGAKLLLKCGGIAAFDCDVLLPGGGTVACTLRWDWKSEALKVRRNSDNREAAVTSRTVFFLCAEDAALCIKADSEEVYRVAAEADTRRRNREVEMFAQHQVNRAKHWNRGSLAIGGRG